MNLFHKPITPNSKPKGRIIGCHGSGHRARAYPRSLMGFYLLAHGAHLGHFWLAGIHGPAGGPCGHWLVQQSYTDFPLKKKKQSYTDAPSIPITR